MWNEQNNQNSGNYQYGGSQGNQSYNGMNPNSMPNTQYNNTQYGNQSYNNSQTQYNSQGYSNGSYGNMQNTQQYNGMYNNMQNNTQYQNLSNTSQYGNMMNQYNQSYNGMNPNTMGNNGFNGYQITGAGVTPKKPKNKKVLIAIIAVIIIVIIVLAFFLLKGKKSDKKPSTNTSSQSNTSTNVSNYESAMIEYGKKAEEFIQTYKKDNNKLPDMIEVTDNVKIDYKVYCDEKIIYPDGALYLNKCSINASDPIYTYGNPREENKIMKEYGALALAYVSDYQKVYGALPTTLNVEYEGKVVCDKVNIYDVNNIYLSECSVNDSEKIYSYGYQKDKGFVYIAYTQLNNEVYGENTTAYYESGSANSKVIKCATLNCSLDNYLGRYVAIKESTGKVSIYDITSAEEKVLYTIDKGVTYAFLRDGDTSVYGLLLRNTKGQEALFAFGGRNFVYDYGKYYYDWTSSSTSEIWWDHHPLFAATNLLVVRKSSGNKYGLVNLRSRKEVIPCENDLIFMKNKYLHVVKSNKISLYNSTGGSKKLKGKSYDALAVSTYNNNYTMVYGNNVLEIVDIDGKLIKKVADIPATNTLLLPNRPHENIKVVDNTTFQVVFKTNKTKTSCARYNYDMQTMKLLIDEKECSYFSK